MKDREGSRELKNLFVIIVTALGYAGIIYGLDFLAELIANGIGQPRTEMGLTFILFGLAFPYLGASAWHIYQYIQRDE